MPKDQLTKQQAKALKAQHKEFRWWFRKAKKKLKKATMSKEVRTQLIQDLEKCNNAEIMHYLATAAVFSSDDEFIQVINKWLEMETITYSYPFELRYKVGNMENITELIRLQHGKIELEKEIFGE